MLPLRCASVVVALLVVSLATRTAAAVRSSDPRCVDVECPTKPYTMPFASDSSTCEDDATPCPKCLLGTAPDGDDWATVIAALGANVTRALRPALIINNWLSAEVTDMVAMILLREVMGFDTKSVPTPIDGTTEILCCDDGNAYVEFEKWQSGRMHDDENYGTLSQLPVGYEGGSGLFVPEYTEADWPLATAMAAYKHNYPYRHGLLPGTRTANASLMVNANAEADDPNPTMCGKNAWPNTTCDGAYYVPPQCVNNLNCSDIYLADPTWDKSRFEALVKNQGLNWTIAYMGGGNLGAHAEALYAAHQHFVFYWWEPDPLVAKVRGRPINFPRHNFECEQRYLATTGADPSTSGYDCAYPMSLLLKIARKDTLSQDSDFQFFFENFQIGGGAMNSMLQRHTSAGGNRSVWNVSCDWIKSHRGTWSSWIRSASSANAAAAGSNAATLGGAIGGALGVALLAVVGLVVVTKLRKMAALKHAPREAPLVAIFTDIQASTALAEMHGSDMQFAVQMHHEIWRELFVEYGAYEVKVIGDAFVVAMKSLTDATLMCLEAQKRLYAADWPARMKYWLTPEEAAVQHAIDAGGLDASTFDDVEQVKGLRAEHAALLGPAGQMPPPPGLGFRGLRVRVGVHLCTDAKVEYDETHGGFDYYGGDMNTCARVQGAAHGGQTLMTDYTLEELQKDPDFQSLFGEDTLITKVSNGISLKGLSEKAVLYCLQPVDLAARTFPALEGAPAEGVETLQQSSICTSQHSQACSEGSEAGDASSRMIGKTLKALLDAQGGARKSVLDRLCQKYRVAPKGVEARRVKLVRRALELDFGDGPETPTANQMRAGARRASVQSRSRRGSLGGSRQASLRASPESSATPQPPGTLPAPEVDGDDEAGES